MKRRMYGWARRALLAAALLQPWLGPQAQVATPDAAGWYAARRDSLYRDLPREVALARTQFGNAQRAGDAAALRLWGGWYLSMTVSRVLVDDLQTVYDALTADLAQASNNDSDEPLGRVSALIGMTRFETVARNTKAATEHAALALQKAEHSGLPSLVAEARLATAAAQLDGAQAAIATAGLVEVMRQTAERPQVIEARIMLATSAMYAASSNDELMRVVQQSLQSEAEMKALGLPWAAYGFAEWAAGALARTGRGDEALQQLTDRQQELARQGMDGSAVLAFRVARAADMGLALAQAYRKSPRGNLCAQLVARQLPVPDLPGTRISVERLVVLCRAAARDPHAIEAIQALERTASSATVTASAAFEESLWNSVASAYALAGAYEDAHRSALQFRRASLKRVGQANEVARAAIESKHELAAQRQENDHLRSSQAIEAQRRLFMGAALGILVVTLAVVGVLLRVQTVQRRRLAIASAKLAQANDRLTALHASRNRMLAAACHDLRQPAHAIGLLSEVLTHADAPSSVGSVQELRRSSAVLADMLDVMIDMTQLESDRYEPRVAAVPMSELLLEVQAQFTQLAERKGLALQVDAPANLWALTDRHLLRRMLFNLVSNAIKYTRRGRVIVRCQATPQGLLVRVEDTGVGIPPEKQQDIFSEFVRLDALRDAEQGLGIGLSVVARAARLLGVSIRVQSTVGEGSVFSVLLPVAPAGLATEAEADAPARPLRIVVMEDDATIRGAMSKLLRAAGHEVHEFATPDAMQASVDAGEVRRPDLIISDLHLSGANGLDAIARSRDYPGWQDVPAILLTGDLAGRVASQAAAMGVLMAYKPLPTRRLFEAIARATAAA